MIQLSSNFTFCSLINFNQFSSATSKDFLEKTLKSYPEVDTT